jgi:aerobic-type carbon monoxide dehydrogenase small subunit (CoxS/CutS family)
MPDQLTITVNGVPHIVEATASMPLLYVLRNELRLCGPSLAVAVRHVYRAA